MKRSIFLGIFLSCLNTTYAGADLFIFSFDRPMQLYALLESIQKYISGINDIALLYRTSNEEYELAYRKVFEQFPGLIIAKQGPNPRQDFKPLTIQLLQGLKSEYILFAVDDIIVKDYVDLNQGIKFLELKNAYGVFLRLGTHLTYCYSMQRLQPVPAHELVEDDIVAWRIGSAMYDWGYPHTVDMTLYRKKDIMPDFIRLNYSSPNTLEGSWASLGSRARSSLGLCYTHSKIVNLPLNLVQDTFLKNPCSHSFSTNDLLKLFNEGKKIDINTLYKINNQSAHIDFLLTFIERVPLSE